MDLRTEEVLKELSGAFQILDKQTDIADSHKKSSLFSAAERRRIDEFGGRRRCRQFPADSSVGTAARVFA